MSILFTAHEAVSDFVLMKACFVCPRNPKMEQCEIWWIIGEFRIQNRNLILKWVNHQASFGGTIAMRLVPPVDRFIMCVWEAELSEKNKNKNL